MAHKIPFANPQKQYQDHRDEFIKVFDDVLTRGDIVMRGDLKKFEEDFAKFVGVKYAIGVNSGTSAIYLAMRGSGIKPGDEVITVAHTFIASISIPYMLNAQPVLIDVQKDFNMDPSLIEKALTKKTTAIEPVHLNGRLCDMEVILDIAQRKGLLVIEDAAQALGAKMQMADGNWRMAGSFGNASCFSLYWAKVLGGWGNNGMVTTDDPEIADKARFMRYNGEDRESRHFNYHSHNLIMDNLHAAILNVKLKYFPSWLLRRRELAERYQKGLFGVKQIILPVFDDARFYDVYTNYVIRAERRDELKKYLDENQLFETIISWPNPTYKEAVFIDPKYNQEFGLPRLVSKDGETKELPETEKICKEVLSLPMYPELENSQVDYVIKCIKDFYC